uniref:HAT C-terminal dimerisation domain-containing protein n=1 Tax=Meloidogyne incognita TaxID=6306 RepID=A0A914MD40_MELIC
MVKIKYLPTRAGLISHFLARKVSHFAFWSKCEICFAFFIFEKKSKGATTTEWPILSKIAKHFLSAPCTSAEAERLFSSAGLIINNLRKSLLQENAEMLLFLHHNLVIYNFEYE